MKFINLSKWMEYVINGNLQDRTIVALIIPFQSNIMKLQYLPIQLEQLPFTRFFCVIYSHSICIACCVFYYNRKEILPKRDVFVTCLCGGSGAELLSLLLSFQDIKDIHLHITIIDKESLWERTYPPFSLIILRITCLKKTLKNHFSIDFSCEFIVMDLLLKSYSFDN